MTPALSIELIPGGLVLGGRTWTGELASEAIQSALGVPSRTEVKLAHGRPWRIVAYYDEDGIYILHDLESKRVVYLGIALNLEGVSFAPKLPFNGQLVINGRQLVAGMTERELPLRGTINFVKGIGSTWKCAHDHGYVELNLKKVTLSNGRKSSQPVLASVTHSFLKN
jgi:hypothetical protein